MFLTKTLIKVLTLALTVSLLFALSACSASAPPKDEESPAATDVTVTNVVTVSNVDELLAAIAPNTEIHLSQGSYNLTEAKNYGKVDASEYYKWNNYGFEHEYELFIDGVDNLRLIGNNSEILTEPRSVNVISFENCEFLVLKGLTLGHTRSSEACEGAVLRLDYSHNAEIEDCSLYGCGTSGVYATNSDKMRITGTEIYNCSYTGIDYYFGRDLTVENCAIYKCGTEEQYSYCTAPFYLCDAVDVKVSGCEIYDNYACNLICGYGIEKASFSGLKVINNSFSCLFDYTGDVEITNISLSDNSINSCIGNYGNSTVSIDGSELTEAELEELWKDQMTSSGIGTVDVEYASIDRTGAKEKHVSTADQLLKAIGSNVHIIIDVPQINLTEASTYGEGAAGSQWDGPELQDKSYVWSEEYDGFQLCICNVDNFHISGGEIITEPRYANVLGFYSCSNISLENVKLGHSPEEGACCGGVLMLNGSQNIIVQSCDLYGCGVVGIDSENSDNIHVQDTLIHDCSWCAAQLSNSDSVVFLNCTVKNCPKPHVVLYNCSNLSWDGTLMNPNCSFNADTEDGSEEPDGFDLVNLRGDIVSVTRVSDGVYTDADGVMYTFDGFENYIDDNGVQWNRTLY